MEFVELMVEERQASGSANARRMRKAGRVPAVVYGAGSAAQSIEVNGHAFTMAARGKSKGQLFMLKSEKSALNGSLVLVKNVQSEPMKERLLHIDFFAIQEGHMLHVKVPLELTGDPIAVKEARGVVTQTIYELDVRCLPTKIPAKITLEIGTLEEGESLHASDIKMPEGVELYDNPELVIVTLNSVAAQPEEEPAAAVTTAKA